MPDALAWASAAAALSVQRPGASASMPYRTEIDARSRHEPHRMTTARTTRSTPAPLTGLRVLDLATLFAGPLAATMLGDFGAEVIKVEHPREARPLARPRPVQGRHRPVVEAAGPQQAHDDPRPLHARRPGRAAAARRRPPTSSSRTSGPGTLEKWGLGWEELSAANPRLVLARVTGFGQFGPYAHRPGFGTLAEAMSGFAAITGEPDGPPTLPPFGLADSIAAPGDGVRGDDGPGRPRPHRRGPGRRHGDHRADPHRPRPAAALVRPARPRPAAHRQPLAATTPPATPTARPTAPGSPSRPRPSRSPSA